MSDQHHKEFFSQLDGIIANQRAHTAIPSLQFNIINQLLDAILVNDETVRSLFAEANLNHESPIEITGFMEQLKALKNERLLEIINSPNEKVLREVITKRFEQHAALQRWIRDFQTIESLPQEVIDLADLQANPHLINTNAIVNDYLPKYIIAYFLENYFIEMKSLFELGCSYSGYMWVKDQLVITESHREFYEPMQEIIHAGLIAALESGNFHVASLLMKSSFYKDEIDFSKAIEELFVHAFSQGNIGLIQAIAKLHGKLFEKLKARIADNEEERDKILKAFSKNVHDENLTQFKKLFDEEFGQDAFDKFVSVAINSPNRFSVYLNLFSDACKFRNHELVKLCLKYIDIKKEEHKTPVLRSLSNAINENDGLIANTILDHFNADEKFEIFENLITSKPAITIFWPHINESDRQKMIETGNYRELYRSIDEGDNEALYFLFEKASQKQKDKMLEKLSSHNFSLTKGIARNLKNESFDFILEKFPKEKHFEIISETIRHLLICDASDEVKQQKIPHLLSKLTEQQLEKLRQSIDLPTLLAKEYYESDITYRKELEASQNIYYSIRNAIALVFDVSEEEAQANMPEICTANLIKYMARYSDSAEEIIAFYEQLSTNTKRAVIPDIIEAVSSYNTRLFDEITNHIWETSDKKQRSLVLNAIAKVWVFDIPCVQDTETITYDWINKHWLNSDFRESRVRQGWLKEWYNANTDQEKVNLVFSSERDYAAVVCNALDQWWGSSNNVEQATFALAILDKPSKLRGKVNSNIIQKILILSLDTNNQVLLDKIPVKNVDLTLHRTADLALYERYWRHASDEKKMDLLKESLSYHYGRTDRSQIIQEQTLVYAIEMFFHCNKNKKSTEAESILSLLKNNLYSFQRSLAVEEKDLYDPVFQLALHALTKLPSQGNKAQIAQSKAKQAQILEGLYNVLKSPENERLMSLYELTNKMLKERENNPALKNTKTGGYFWHSFFKTHLHNPFDKKWSRSTSEDKLILLHQALEKNEALQQQLNNSKVVKSDIHSSADFNNL